MTLRKHTLPTRVAAGSLLALTAGFGLSACSETTGDEEGATVEDIQDEDADEGVGAVDADIAYDGPYDAEFHESFDGYEGETVTVSADVERVLSDEAFTIAGGDVEELLVVSAEGNTTLDEDSLVKVTGVVHTAFDLPEIEMRLGDDLDDDLFEEWDAEPYIEATSIETDPEVEDS